MSFMFKPSQYFDPSAVNELSCAATIFKQLTLGYPAIAQKIAEHVKGLDTPLICMEGYPSAEFSPLVQLCGAQLYQQTGKTAEIISIQSVYHSSEEIEEKLKPYLPEDRQVDPVLLYGKRLENGFDQIICQEALDELIQRLQNRKSSPCILYGFGSLYPDAIRELADVSVYLDVIPKEVAIRAKNGRMVNMGDQVARPFRALMRRAYYVDFEAGLALRTRLLKEGGIDFYIASSDSQHPQMLPFSALCTLAKELSQKPIRNSPVYLEGVWGGQYIKKIRNIPDKDMKNVAWSFDFIPMEVSVAVQLKDQLIQIPFYTLLQLQAEAIMGKSCTEKFGGYFPIRFNYDDTFHSSGNMSIQVHSNGPYNKEHYNEIGRQDESYYIVTAGHGARTYLGFRDDADPQEFIREIKQSEKMHQPVDYQRYIHAEVSKPGLQVMIPAGTVHASGRNQVILEIGSLTVGSYTYKLYDYLRLDLDGQPRPIHTWHGERVLVQSRNEEWVKKNVVQSPRTIRQGEGWRETILGEHDLLYFSLRHLEFEKEIEDCTKDIFHVLTLVDGEHVVIESLDHPEYCYHAHYMDIVLVPASVGRYVIRNLGDHPVIVHKTCLKDGFEADNQ